MAHFLEPTILIFLVGEARFPSKNVEAWNSLVEGGDGLYLPKW